MRSLPFSLIVASSRYVPGSSSGSSGYQSLAYQSAPDPYSAPHSVTKPRKHLPQTSYLSFQARDVNAIVNKINTFNSEIPKEIVTSPSNAIDIRLSPQKK